MNNKSIALLILLVLPSVLLGSEKVVISQWLSTGPLPLRYPAFHETRNVHGRQFSNTELLSFSHMNLTDYFPKQSMDFGWFNGTSATWQAVFADEKGFLVLHDSSQTARPQVAYLATYIRADRWLSTQLEIRSPYMLEAYLNGNRIGSKTTLENEEGTTGKVTKELKLPKGTHLLVLKTLRPPQQGPEWRLTASLEIKEPFGPGDLAFSLNPTNIKNINHILDGVKITRVQPSADGKHYAISFRQSQPPTDQSETWTDIRRTSDNRLVHSFRHSRASRFAWLTKGSILSYVTTRNDKSTIHWHNLETGQVRSFLNETEKLGMFRWAPDGSYIIYSIREDGTGADGTLRQVLGMQDRQPDWRNRSFLYKYDMVSGLKTRLTYGNVSTSLLDISPDSQKLLIGLTRPDYQQRPFSKSDILIIDVGTLTVDTVLVNQRWGVSATFSPDGTRLLATGGPSALDGAGVNVPQGTIPNNYDRQAYIYDLKQRTAVCITLNFDPSVSSVFWHPADNHIYLQVVEEDFQRLYRYDVRRQRFSRVETGLDMLTSIDFALNQPLAAFIGSQTNAPPKAYLINLKNNSIQLLDDTESNTYRHVQFGEVRDWNFTTSANVNIKGRYYLPPDFDPEKKYPVIVYYYAGTTPVGRTFGGRYPFNLWASNGYVVYVMQPSGAIGFGQQFSAAHVNNWGITVADEIIESAKAFLNAHPFTDPSRVGCAGASYGGFMTMLLLTRTDMFATGISHAGISSISSYWGEGFWGYAYSAEATADAFPWNRPDIYVGQSPLFLADRINTPLLLITGDSDTNVPPGESIQMFTALKILGRPVELVLVKGEDHQIITYNRRIEWHNTIMAWWERYLKNKPQWWFDLYPEKNY